MANLKELLEAAKKKDIVPVPAGNSPASPEEQVQMLIAQLAQELEQQIPSYKNTLSTIHKRLLAEEELVHILKEEEIGVIMNGQQKLTNTVIKTAAIKKTSTRKSLANITLDQL